MLTKSDLIARVAADTELPKATVERVLETAGKHIADNLATIDEAEGGAILPGLGRLVVQQRAGRTGRNPATGEPIEIPAKRVVRFRAAGSLAQAVE